MRLLTGLMLGGILAAGALGAALSQMRIDPATGVQVPNAATLSRLPRGGQVDWRAAAMRQSGGGDPAPPASARPPP